jgi:hypothetical protein
VSPGLFKLGLLEQSVLVYRAQEVGKRVADRHTNEILALLMEQPLLTVDVVLILEGEKEGVPKIGLKGIAGRCRWPMLVFADSNCSAEELLQCVDGRVLNKVFHCRRRQRRSAVHVDATAGALADIGIATGDENLPAIQLNQQRVPANVLPYDSIGCAAAGAMDC